MWMSDAYERLIALATSDYLALAEPRLERVAEDATAS
jgi:hypothetical protein